jgi:radical SAM superfamily enzyme YgiQ (UPF0313 family)
MKILLLYTEMDVWALGLRSISAVLQAAGHSTCLILLGTIENSYPQKTLEDVAAFARDADLIGISCLARGSDKAKQIIDRLRSQNKLIVWGGVHASLNPEECAEWANIVCLGEGEEMILELLERLEQGKDWKDIKNIAYKENEAYYLNKPRPPIRDLDELPLPDFTFKNEYHLLRKRLVQVTTLDDAEHRILFNSSRGCAFHCTYCCNVKIKNLYDGTDRYVRRMSIPRLIEHAKNLRRIFSTSKTIYFIDEDFGARPINELQQLSEDFHREVGLPFECLTHPAQVSRQKMDLLVKAGLYRLNMGIESGSERTRTAIYNRHVSNKIVKRAVSIIREYPQIIPFYFFIIANPYEEPSDLITTIHFITELPPICNITIYNLVFFPGSELYERAVQDTLIEGEQDSGYQLDFLGGLNYQGHPWKKKNLYLNGLLSFMGGSCSKRFIGNVPRIFVRALLHPKHMEFHEKNPFVFQTILSIKSTVTSIGHLGGQLRKMVHG